MFVDYKGNVAQQISRLYSSYLTETLCLLTRNYLYTPPPSPWQLPFHSASMILTVLDTHICGIIQYLPFCDWFISLSIMSSRFIDVVLYHRISFFLKAEKYSIVCVYVCVWYVCISIKKYGTNNHIFFIHSSVDKHQVVSTSWLCFRWHIHEIVAKTNIKDIFPYVFF